MAPYNEGNIIYVYCANGIIFSKSHLPDEISLNLKCGKWYFEDDLTKDYRIGFDSTKLEDCNLEIGKEQIIGVYDIIKPGQRHQMFLHIHQFYEHFFSK